MRSIAPDKRAAVEEYLRSAFPGLEVSHVPLAGPAWSRERYVVRFADRSEHSVVFRYEFLDDTRTAAEITETLRLLDLAGEMAAREMVTVRRHAAGVEAVVKVVAGHDASTT